MKEFTISTNDAGQRLERIEQRRVVSAIIRKSE